MPVRLLEWLAVIWFFYERRSPAESDSARWSRAFKWSALGILWSGLLDIPALLAVFALPGGVWVC